MPLHAAQITQNPMCTVSVISARDTTACGTPHRIGIRFRPENGRCSLRSTYHSPFLVRSPPRKTSTCLSPALSPQSSSLPVLQLSATLNQVHRQPCPVQACLLQPVRLGSSSPRPLHLPIAPATRPPSSRPTGASTQKTRERQSLGISPLQAQKPVDRPPGTERGRNGPQPHAGVKALATNPSHLVCCLILSGGKEKAPGDPLRTQELPTVASFRTWRGLGE